MSGRQKRTFISFLIKCDYHDDDDDDEYDDYDDDDHDGDEDEHTSF